MTLLEVLHLSKHFQRDGHTVRAVDGISFAVEAGSAFALIGESGSGKTTTAYCLARLMEPTAGSIRFDGQNWLSLRGRALRERRHRLQLVFQDPYTSLNPVMTIGETVEEPLRLRGVRSPGERHDGVRALLEQVGVGPELMSRRPAALSGGQRQRVSLARALACEPALLVADEPVSALDEDARGEILGLLARLRERRKLALILIAHDLETVRAVCEKTAVIWRGRIVEHGPTEEILEQPLHPYTRHLVAAAGMRNTPPPGATSALDELREVEPGHWAALP